MRTKSKAILYWWCQLGGWLLYGLTMVFFAFVFDSKINSIFYPKLLVIISIWLIFYPCIKGINQIIPPASPRIIQKMGAVYRGFNVDFSAF
jgi:two-component system LytT family sensor kinase